MFGSSCDPYHDIPYRDPKSFRKHESAVYGNFDGDIKKDRWIFYLERTDSMTVFLCTG